jgi:hypothetical protein
MLVAFFDECWRILKPGGKLTLIWPALQSVRAFQDPTHRRFIPLETLNYLSDEWRRANGLGHYLGACDFKIVESGFATVDERFRQQGELGNPEAVAGVIARSWNLLADFRAVLEKPAK